MSKRLAALAALAALVAGTGCGSKPAPPKPKKLPPSVVKACPDATHGQGQMGECTPERTIK